MNKSVLNFAAVFVKVLYVMCITVTEDNHKQIDGSDLHKYQSSNVGEFVFLFVAADVRLPCLMGHCKQSLFGFWSWNLIASGHLS